VEKISRLIALDGNCAGGSCGKMSARQSNLTHKTIMRDMTYCGQPTTRRREAAVEFWGLCLCRSG
jgi:hypothetical protein